MKTDTYSAAIFSKFTHYGSVARWIIRQPSAFISFYCSVRFEIDCSWSSIATPTRNQVMSATP